MWIFLSDAFLSVVEPTKADLPKQHRHHDVLLVRARRPADITRVFKDATVIRLQGRDYAYRAFIDRVEVAKALAEQVARIDYSNFKGSVVEDPRHEAYMDVWSAMHRYQSGHYDKPARKLNDRFSPYDHL